MIGSLGDEPKNVRSQEHQGEVGSHLLAPREKMFVVEDRHSKQLNRSRWPKVHTNKGMNTVLVKQPLGTTVFGSSDSGLADRLTFPLSIQSGAAVEHC